MNINQLTDSQKYDLAVQLGTTKGFFQYYFDQLPQHKSQIDSFEAANQLHYDIFKEYKYSDYHSFRRSMSYHLNNK